MICCEFMSFCIIFIYVLFFVKKTRKGLTAIGPGPGAGPLRWPGPGPGRGPIGNRPGPGPGAWADRGQSLTCFFHKKIIHI